MKTTSYSLIKGKQSDILKWNCSYREILELFYIHDVRTK